MSFEFFGWIDQNELREYWLPSIIEDLTTSDSEGRNSGNNGVNVQTNPVIVIVPAPANQNNGSQSSGSNATIAPTFTPYVSMFPNSYVSRANPNVHQGNNLRYTPI